jgi:hypothetical protein
MHPTSSSHILYIFPGVQYIALVRVYYQISACSYYSLFVDAYSMIYADAYANMIIFVTIVN